jgi:hypothetical protein
MTSPRDQTMKETVQDKSIPEGFLLFLFTSTFFAMDLVGKNLQMNGVDAVWFYPDLNELPEDRPSLYVRADQKEQALTVISSLDLTDFITYHGQ